ncbi:hypothetical protein [Streptomyces goshikiensis]
MSEEAQGGWQQRQDEHDKGIEQIADRKFGSKAGLTDTCDDVPITST